MTPRGEHAKKGIVLNVAILVDIGEIGRAHV